MGRGRGSGRTNPNPNTKLGLKTGIVTRSKTVVDVSGDGERVERRRFVDAGPWQQQSVNGGDEQQRDMETSHVDVVGGPVTGAAAAAAAAAGSATGSATAGADEGDGRVAVGDGEGWGALRMGGHGFDDVVREGSARRARDALVVNASGLVMNAPGLRGEESPVRVGAGPVQEAMVSASPWKDLFTKSSGNPNGIHMKFVSSNVVNGTHFGQVDVGEFERLSSMWNRAMVFFPIGASPPIDSVIRYIAAAWKHVAKPKVQYHKDGYYLIMFQTGEECQSVLDGGPYTMGGNPILIRRWTQGFNLHDELRVAPIWVRFPGLPVVYWGVNTLSSIASTMGVPLMADNCTARQSRVEYARVLIEVNITKELPKCVHYYDEVGKERVQNVTYEWVPYFCTKCQMFGHDCGKTRPQHGKRKLGPEQQWRTKGKTEVDKEEGASTVGPSGVVEQDNGSVPTVGVVVEQGIGGKEAVPLEHAVVLVEQGDVVKGGMHDLSCTGKDVGSGGDDGWTEVQRRISLTRLASPRSRDGETGLVDMSRELRYGPPQGPRAI